MHRILDQALQPWTLNPTPVLHTRCGITALNYALYSEPYELQPLQVMHMWSTMQCFALQASVDPVPDQHLLHRVHRQRLPVILYMNCLTMPCLGLLSLPQGLHCTLTTP